jgi:DNA-binding protein HU-beta
MTTKGELVNQVADKTGMGKDVVKRVLNESLNGIVASLANGEKVQLIGFGTFYTTMRPGKVGRSMKTGQPIKIPPATVARFKAGVEIKKNLAMVDGALTGTEGCRSVFLPRG